MDKSQIMILDPTKFMFEDLPLICLSSHANNPIAWLIRLRTNSSYNHAMWLWRPGHFASQGLVFEDVPLQSYLRPKTKLKFWRIKNMTGAQKVNINDRIVKRINLPWWRRRYDFLGVLGQAVGLKFLNNPFTSYCSEVIAADLSSIFSRIPKHPSPEDLDTWFKAHPDLFEYVGHVLID